MAAKLALVEIKICVPAAKTANFFLTMSAIYPATALMAITKMLLQINAHHVTRNASNDKKKKFIQSKSKTFYFII